MADSANTNALLSSFDLGGASARRILDVVNAVRALYEDREAMGALERLAGATGAAGAAQSADSSPRQGGFVPPLRKRPRRNPNPCGFCSHYKQKCELVNGNKNLCVKCRDLGRSTCYPKRQLPGPEMYSEDGEPAIFPGTLSVPSRVGSSSPSSGSHHRHGSGDSGPSMQFSHPTTPIHAHLHEMPAQTQAGSALDVSFQPSYTLSIEAGANMQRAQAQAQVYSAQHHHQQAQAIYYSPPPNGDMSLTPISVSSNSSGATSSSAAAWPQYSYNVDFGGAPDMQ